MEPLLKDGLRKHFRRLREAIPAPHRREASFAIVENVQGLAQWKDARAVLLYASFGTEVETPRLLEAAWATGKAVGLPRMEGKDLVVHEARSGDTLVGNPLGIPEPSIDSPLLSIERVSLVAVPGVAFDRRGARLGYGGGYYDRLLRTVPHAYRVGVAYEAQVVDRLPTNHLDVPMDALATEGGIRVLPKREH
jgi:5-formyltetrahydrofolate cyclo-ligase